MTSFPSDNTPLTTPGEFYTKTDALTGTINAIVISCTTSTTNCAYAYGQYNVGFDLTSTSAGNICSVYLTKKHDSYETTGAFIYNSAGEFVDSTGTTLTSGVGDSTIKVYYYYAGVQSI